MDFFKYASYAGTFTNILWVQMLVGGLCFAIVYILEAVALFTIAARAGYKNKWMAFIPFLNTYYIGVCAQKNKFYNIDAKKLGITAAVFEFVLFGLYLVYYIAQILIINSNVSPIISNDWLGFEEWFYDLDAVRAIQPDLVWAAWMYDYMYEYILSVLELVFLLIQISLLISFFQTYASRRYVLFTVTSVLFPIQGILFFVVRNNKGVNYKEFLRAEQARQYAMYQQYQQQNFNQNPYNNNYNNYNNYNNNNNSYNDPYGDGFSNEVNRQAPPEDPFGDLGGSDKPHGSCGSPFDDFDKN